MGIELKCPEIIILCLGCWFRQEKGTTQSYIGILAYEVSHFAVFSFYFILILAFPFEK